MGNNCGKWIGAGLEFFFEYETNKIVHISSVKLGVVNRLLQIVILAFVIGYSIVYEKGYQTFDTPISSVTTKVKGIGFTNISARPRVFDVADLVVPQQMKDSFFVMTNAIITPSQNQSKCAEDPKVPGVDCTHDPAVCQNGKHDFLGNGVQTGRCVDSSENGTKVCEIWGWCPVETREANETPLFPEAVNFTVLIKNNVRFPLYGVKRRNILETQDSDFLRNCTYEPNHPEYKLCPIFKLGTILNESGIDFNDAGVYGAVVSISIIWECDFDYSVENCIPQYKFFRVDTPNAKISPGFNFRYANYWKEGGEDWRSLYKAYGILFIIQVQGRGGKFDVIPLATKLGSGLALLAIVSVVCDILLLYCVKMRNVYRDKKYLFVTGDDAFDTQILGEGQSLIENENSQSGDMFDERHSGDDGGIQKRTSRQDPESSGVGAGYSRLSGAS